MTREEAIEWLELEKLQAIAQLASPVGKLCEAYSMAIEALKQPEQKKGTWMVNSGIGTICSNCFYKLETTGLLSKCPHCGAKMDGE